MARSRLRRHRSSSGSGVAMIWEILVLGFVLSLDNFRVSIALGTVPFGLKRAVQVALAFGLWDAIMPLVGLLIGHQIGESVGDVADVVGAAALGGYGLYLVVSSLRKPEPDELDHPWALFGIPLTLSLDNLFAGASLGVLGLSPWFSAAVFGAMTAVLSLVGLQLGRAAAHLIRIRSDLLSGVTLIIAAAALPLWFGG
ncbi:manganese efflux pump MntP family protein [Streptomyces sp. NPDC048521]|uniref:manganese efflux pump MntP n=1 Tax=Streptomyces sp. NPDC048521 TaxID=3365566 RepID=UPI003712C0A2